MKKKCPHCNKDTFNYWELFFPYPIRNFSIPCLHCSTRVYPVRIFIIIPQMVMSLFLTIVALLVVIHIAFGQLPEHITFVEIEVDGYYGIFEIFIVLLAPLCLARFLDIRLFDLVMEKEHKGRV